MKQGLHVLHVRVGHMNMDCSCAHSESFAVVLAGYFEQACAEYWSCCWNNWGGATASLLDTMCPFPLFKHTHVFWSCSIAAHHVQAWAIITTSTHFLILGKSGNHDENVKRI